MASKRKVGTLWVYDIDARRKAEFATFITQEATADELAKFAEALEDLRPTVDI